MLAVLIVGAGVGGNALAFWLSKLGYSVTVIERHFELRVNGLQLDLRGHGIEIVRRMGLENIIRTKCVPEEGMALVDSNGRQRAFFAANRSGKGAQSITSEFEIMRGDLCRVLHDAAVSLGAKYSFGISVTGLENKHDGVEVEFTDGRVEKYDLVAGCDGQGSRVRRLMLGYESRDADANDSALTTLHERVAYFTIPRPIQEKEKYIATAYLMPEKKFLLLRRHNQDQMQVYLKADTFAGSGQLANMKRGDVEGEKKAFAELFQGSGWRTDEVVKALREGADDFYCQYTGFVKMERWSRGRVTLVGDAGYGCPPDGFGTSVALLGAYVLAGELSNHCQASSQHSEETTKSQNSHGREGQSDILRAVQAYEDTFQPFIREMQKGYSAEPSLSDKIPWTPFTVGAFNYAMSLVSYLKIDRIIARLMPAENAKGWRIPKYNKMEAGKEYN